MNEPEIFAAAIKLSGDARHAFLDAACGQDVQQREQIEALLKAHEESGGLLPKRSDPRLDQTHVVLRQAEPGVVIAGRYKLLEQIGEGGMGTVWVAEQSQPVKRKVALKLIKAGMDSRSVLARFEAERQALALMDHPNIAKVLDGGLTETGRPYFVMDYVKGVPITEYCDATRLSVPDRLQLFVQVCQAVQHAHQKGIIHRDLKPSNILVAPYDDKPVPKVIDFGLAKAMNQSLTEKTLHTAHDMVLGTPQYMSPEQATFNNLDIDTRSDVYSLGTLLYELLAGSPPFAQPELEKRGLLEILRVVREEEPPRPSLKLSTAEARASISANRSSEPLQLSTMMQGEIDWIVMKALEKDRTRRYDSANGLAADVQRYLSGEQVQAVPPSMGYRLAKAYRRNRAAVLVSIAFSLMLLTGGAVAAVLAIQARRAEAMAEAKQVEAQEQAAKAELFAADYRKLSSVYWEAAIAAEIRSASARIDADLLEYKADPRVGLLRLARPLKDFVGPLEIDFPSGTKKHSRSFENEPEFLKLREFQTAAVISAGQEFVPLVPPFVTPDQSSVTESPDGLLCIGGTERTGLELLAIPSLKKIGTLREDAERVLKYGFSPDGKTIYTQDTDSIVRFWNTDATLRAKTPLRPERFIYPAGMRHEEICSTSTVANQILVADGVALLRSEQRIGVKPGHDYREWHGRPGAEGPTELYSTHTGKFLRRLDRPGRRLSAWLISPDNRWLIYNEDTADEQGNRQPDQSVTEIVVSSTADGREEARLKHLDTKLDVVIKVSPFGKWILTYERDFRAYSDRDTSELSNVRLWRTSDWTQIKDDALDDALRMQDQCNFGFEFIAEDLISCRSVHKPVGIGEGLLRIGKSGFWIPEKSLDIAGSNWGINAELCGTLLRINRLLFTNDPINRLMPPQGRKYAAELAMLAPDGRFWEGLDTIAEKELPYSHEGKYLPHFGHVGFRIYDGESDATSVAHRGWGDPELRILPDSKRLDFSPTLIELWAQVVVGGELSPEGLFQPWDQPTWAAKQKALAAAKSPYEDFPFPGWAAQEPNLWFFIRAGDRTSGPDHEIPIAEFNRRTNRVRPDLGPDLWRTPELAPMPEEPKSP